MFKLILHTKKRQIISQSLSLYPTYLSCQINNSEVLLGAIISTHGKYPKPVVTQAYG